MPSQLEELLKQGPRTEMEVIIYCHPRFTDYQTITPPQINTDALMRAAVDLYRKIWPVFKHKFPTQTRQRRISAPNPFFHLSVQYWKGSIARGYFRAIFFEGRLTIHVRDRDSFWEAREQAGGDGTRISTPRALNTVR